MNWTLFNNHCYKYFQDQLRGYSEAKAQCETFEASLATIHSKEENDYLWSLFSQSGHNVWVGGNDEAVDGSWVWEDGMAWGGFTLWDSVEPNGGSSENCLEIQRKMANGTTSLALYYAITSAKIDISITIVISIHTHTFYLTD